MVSSIECIIKIENSTKIHDRCESPFKRNFHRAHENFGNFVSFLNKKPMWTILFFYCHFHLLIVKLLPKIVAFQFIANNLLCFFWGGGKWRQKRKTNTMLPSIVIVCTIKNIFSPPKWNANWLNDCAVICTNQMVCG